MDKITERRREQRLRYHWPVWFAGDANDGLIQGQMVDISSKGAAFTCHADESGHYTGQDITARFSVPDFGPDDSFDMKNFTRDGRICRIEKVNSFLKCLAIQFAEPLPFKPAEHAGCNCDGQINAALSAI